MCYVYCNTNNNVCLDLHSCCYSIYVLCAMCTAILTTMSVWITELLLFYIGVMCYVYCNTNNNVCLDLQSGCYSIYVLCAMCTAILTTRSVWIYRAAVILYMCYVYWNTNNNVSLDLQSCCYSI